MTIDLPTIITTVLVLAAVGVAVAGGFLLGVESARRALKSLAREKLSADDCAEFIRLLGMMLKDVD